MKQIKDNWLTFDNIDSLSMRLAEDILTIAENSIELNDKFSIVLTGGKSSLALYKLLSKSISDWSKWHIYIGDERCSPLKHKDRNDHVINEIWLNKSLISKSNIYFMKTELGCKEGASSYEKVLSRVENFDVVLLSMGDDGHVASLFVDHSYNDNKSVVVELNSPKPPRKRISMSYSRLNRANNVLKIVNGPSKRQALSAWFRGCDLPINQVCGARERVYICTNALT